MKLRTKLIILFAVILLIPCAVGVVAVLTRMNADIPSILMTGMTALVMVGLIMVIWIYSTVLKPLEKLTEATHNITEGNLDFTLDSEDAGDEISALCRDFEEMRIRLKQNQEDKLQYDRDNKELLSNISHDLKTPITAIKGYVEGIRDGVASSPDKLDKYVRTIYNKANDMDRLIDELSFYTKIDTNRVAYNYERIHIADFFDDCAEEVGLDMDSRGMIFNYSCEVKKDTLVIADVEQMKRVVNNIISNSIKYIDKTPGKISITLTDAGDFVQIDIGDNGRGIATKDLPLIFNRFYRTDSSRNSLQGGSGIGLSIVKKIVEDHGGRIWATSKEGVGTDIVWVMRKYQEA